MGGKSAVEIAEERLRAEQQSYGGYSGGGYQGISLPSLNETPKEQQDRPYYGAPEVKISSSKGQWGSQNEQKPPQPKENSLFGSMKVNDGKKRMDDDSDDDDRPVQQKAPKNAELEINLLDFGNDQPSQPQTTDLLGAGLLDLGAPAQTTGTIDLFDLSTPAPATAPATSSFNFITEQPKPSF